MIGCKVKMNDRIGSERVTDRQFNATTGTFRNIQNLDGRARCDRIEVQPQEQ